MSEQTKSADVVKIMAKFTAPLLDDPKNGLIKLADSDAMREAMSSIASMYRQGCTDVHKWFAIEDEILAANSANLKSALAASESTKNSEQQKQSLNAALSASWAANTAHGAAKMARQVIVAMDYNILPQ